MDSLVLSNLAHRPARTAVSVAGIAIGVLLVVFTVGLAHGLLRERGKREANIGAQIMVRPSGARLQCGQTFSIRRHGASLCASRARMGVPRTAVPLSARRISFALAAFPQKAVGQTDREDYQ